MLNGLCVSGVKKNVGPISLFLLNLLIIITTLLHFIIICTDWFWGINDKNAFK